MGTMKISQALAVLPRMSPSSAVLIRGPHGIGKSALVQQVAAILRETTGLAYPVIDRRLAQMTEGDLLGLPLIEDGKTRWCPPDWIQMACEQPCILFLDEINRASREVQANGFQLALDRELSNGARLHPETRVYAAANTGAMYQINRMDPALLDRFATIDLLFDAKEWLGWAQRNGLPTRWLDFLAGQTKWLETHGTANDPNAKGTSARSAVKCGVELRSFLDEGDARLKAAHTQIEGFSDGQQAASGATCFDLDNIRRIVSMLMGADCAADFEGYIKDLAANRHIITGEDVFERYDEIRDLIDRRRPDVMTAVIDRWLLHCEGILSVENMTVTEKQGNNFTLLLQDLHGDHRVTLYQRMLGWGMPRVHFIKAIHPYGVRLLLEVFGTVPGEEGVGMLPTNPGAVIREDEAEDANAAE